MIKKILQKIPILVIFLVASCGGGGSSSSSCVCMDGWISNSCGTQGACSSHGGIRP